MLYLITLIFVFLWSFDLATSYEVAGMSLVIAVSLRSVKFVRVRFAQ